MKKSYLTSENFSNLSITPLKTVRSFLMVFAVCLFSNKMIAATPTISGIDISIACSGSNVRVVLSGSNFKNSNVTSVKMGSTLATNFVINSDTSITAIWNSISTGGTITVTNSSGISLSNSSALFTVNATPSVASILGATGVIIGSTTTFSTTTTGGSWSTSDSTIATVSSTGVITGVKLGTVTITYTLTSGGCSGTATKQITVYDPLIISFDQRSLMSDITIDPCGAIGGGSQQDIDIRSGGVSGATYQWQYSLVNTPYSWQTETANATSTQSQYVISSFGSVAGDYYFRLVMTVNGFSINSDVDHIKVNTLVSTFTSAGTIGDDQNSCTSFNPSTFTEKTAPIGTVGTISYQWQSSTDNVNFTDIAGETSSTYNATSTSSTTYFRRKVTSACVSLYTNTITVTIGLPVTTGVTICPGGSGVLTSAIVPMDATLTTSATDAGSGTGWNNSGNISTTGNATILIAKGGTSNMLSAINYGFRIPTNATIKGVQVDIRRLSSNSGLQDNAVKLIVGGTVVGNNNGATTTSWPITTIATANYGSTTDLWGATLTPAIVNDSNFGVSLVVTNTSTSNTSRTASVDYMQITVTYFLPGTLDWFTASSGGTYIGSGTSFNPVGKANSGLVNTNTAGTYSYYAECSTSSGCRTKTDFVINAIPATPTPSVTQPTLDIPTGSITFTGLPASGKISYAGSIVPITGNTQTISGLVPETYSFNIYNGTSPCPFTISSVIIKPQPTIAAPTVGATTNTCVSKGSVVLSGLPSTGNWTINQLIISGSGVSKIISGSGLSTTISGLAEGTYNFTVTSSGNTSLPSVDVVIKPLVTNTYKVVGGWDLTPSIDQNIVITKDLDISSDLTVCSCTITAAAKNVVVKSGVTLTIINDLKVLENSSIDKGNLTFEDTASLVQINDVINSGHINYQRTTSTLANNYDFVYWSSPVQAQTLGTIWMASNWGDTFYDFNVSANNWGPKYAADIMEVGKGYISRARNGQSGLDYNGDLSNPFAVGGTWTAKFHGVPNNGTINTISTNVVNTHYCLLGNPYPSAIDADEFLKVNSELLDGTLYFWTHSTAISNNAYVSEDYASYNRVGGVGVVTSKVAIKDVLNKFGKPTGKIAAGQSFFATATKSGQVTFNNQMRVAGVTIDTPINTNNNGQFFKTTANQKTVTTFEKDRIWLNLSNSQGVFKQTLVGYVTGATNAFEKTFDGESFDGNTYADFYSIIDNKNLTIQGRALPFDTNDIVPLGFRTTISGDFKIDIDQVDGLLTNQAVYIEDKLTNTVFDLKSGDYTFTTVAGTFNDRFVLRYVNKTLGTDSFSTKDNQVLVSSKNKQIKINSAIETIHKVLVYDLLGRVIYQKDNVRNTECSISNLDSSNQDLLVKTILESGIIVTHKVIL